MKYLEFDKQDLVNLEYSLNREVLRTNRAGSYACHTIAGCNTRKYHGLLVCPMEHLDDDKHVMVSSLDVTIGDGNDEFNLGIHKYHGDLYQPRGHKYIQGFEADIFPKVFYRIGDVRILKESVLVEREQQILIKYTVLDAGRILKFKFTPFLSFRNIHQLSKANMHLNTKSKAIKNGIKMRLYDGYAWLYMQFSKQVEYVHVPDWYYNIEYLEEQNRGYEYHEDQFVPGYFETAMKTGDSIVFSASTELGTPANFKRKLASEVKKRIPRDSFKNCLLNCAEQFLIRIGKRTEVISGYPWYGSRTRDALIALPGLTISCNKPKLFLSGIDTIVNKLKDGLLPDIVSDDESVFNSVDTSLWLFWTIQQFTDEYGQKKEIWTKYGKKLKSIIKAFNKGTRHNIHVSENGILNSGEHGKALTWMNTIVDGIPVTPRNGCAVEVNALWFNALSYTLELATSAGDSGFLKMWTDILKKLKISFLSYFWDDDKKYLADTVDGQTKDWSIRPNQILATSLKYSPLNTEQINSVNDIVKRHLLTVRGVRTLAPRHPDYKGIYQGDQKSRDLACHQGSVWPWLLEYYIESYIKVHKQSSVAYIRAILNDFAPVMKEHGIGSISELYDGNPPHIARGTISHATNVAALLRIIDKLERLEQID